MVKNRGFVPATLSDFRCERLELAKIIFSTWPACTQPCPQTGTHFRADAIIANPPAFGLLLLLLCRFLLTYVVFT